MDCSWIVPDNITIVESLDNRLYIDYESDIPKAYVVFGDNKKSLENAHNWAGKCAVDKTVSGNTEFTFEILECAGHSSQGGKLSFWNCRIRNTDENIDVSVGINSEILCMLLKETTFINGACQGNVILAKYDGQLGVVCKGTKLYSEAIQSQHRKDSLKKGKTTKWQKGFAYRTQNTSDVWIGDAYKPITVSSDYFTKVTYDLRNISKKFHVIVESACIGSDKDDVFVGSWAWQCHTKFVKSFPSRQKDDTVHFSETQTDKLLRDGIHSGVEKALHDGYSEYIVNCLISTDMKITDEMMSNFHKAFNKMLERYNELYFRKHIVICDDGEHVFSDVRSAYDFIVEILNEFRKAK